MIGLILSQATFKVKVASFSKQAYHGGAGLRLHDTAPTHSPQQQDELRSELASANKLLIKYQGQVTAADDSILALTKQVILLKRGQFNTLIIEIKSGATSGVTSGFEMLCVCYRIPAPLVPGVPTNTRLECSIQR